MKPVAIYKITSALKNKEISPTPIVMSSPTTPIVIVGMAKTIGVYKTRKVGLVGFAKFVSAQLILPVCILLGKLNTAGAEVATWSSIRHIKKANVKFMNNNSKLHTKIQSKQKIGLYFLKNHIFLIIGTNIKCIAIDLVKNICICQNY